MPNCQGCAHFREQRSLSKVLRVNRARGTSQAIGEISRHERQLAVSERQQVMHAAKALYDKWSPPPVVSSYCGFREATDGEYHLHEIKNQNGDCPDYLSVSVRRSVSCETCRFWRQAQGPSQDAETWGLILDGNYTTGGMDFRPSGHVSGMIDTLQGSQDDHVSGEILQAAYQHGKTVDVPRYFDWCVKYSSRTGDSYALCSYVNHDNKCHGWSR